MVKIRYSELPTGLHVAAAADHEDTIVYLQPGLTSAQRRAALGRVRSSARMGQGPTLPAPAMARAIAADRVRTNAQIGAAAARRHPMLFLPPAIALVVSAAVFVLMSIQPLTLANPGTRAAVPGLRIGSGQVTKHHHQRGQQIGLRPEAMVPLARPLNVKSASCAAAEAQAGHGSWSAPPTRSSSQVSSRCVRRPQHWAHRL